MDGTKSASVPRAATLSVIAGTATYAVPADFQRLIRLAQIGGAPAFGQSYLEYGGINPYDAYGNRLGGHTLGDKLRAPFGEAQLTIDPTPQTSADRQLVYAAGDALDGGSYATLTDDRATIALLLAASTSLDRLGNAPGGGALVIETGGDKVDFRQQAVANRQQAADYRAQYLAAVASLNAAMGGLG